jgi:hypothetical protein
MTVIATTIEDIHSVAPLILLGGALIGGAVAGVVSLLRRPRRPHDKGVGGDRG